MKIREEDILLVASAADAIIKAQKDRIKELEEQNKYLQEALDAALLNKCRVRKVRVKVYGRSPMDKGHSRTF